MDGEAPRQHVLRQLSNQEPLSRESVIELRSLVPVAVEAWGTDRGDRAFEGIYRLLHEHVHRYARRLLRRNDWAEEVTTYSLAKAARAIGGFSHEQPFIPWLLRIVKNTAWDLLRKEMGIRRKNRIATVPIEELLTLSSDPADPADRIDLERVTAGLPQRSREIFRLRFEDSKTIAAVAERLGVSKRTVHTEIRKLRGLLEKLR